MSDSPQEPRWRAVLRKVGRFQSAVLLTLIYVLLWLPVGLVTRLCADWLRRRSPKDSNWWARPQRFNDPNQLREPF